MGAPPTLTGFILSAQVAWSLIGFPPPEEYFNHQERDSEN